MFASEGNGRFTHAPELVEGTIDARNPVVVAADFNSDGRADLAVFDAGVYVYRDEHSLGHGNPPQLLLSSQDGRLRPSDLLRKDLGTRVLKSCGEIIHVLRV